MAVVTGTAAAAGAKAVGAGAKAAAGGAKAAETAGGAAKAADTGLKAGRAGNASQPATVGRGNNDSKGGKGDKDNKNGDSGNNSKPGADNKDSGKKDSDNKKDKKNKDGDKNKDNKDSKSQDSKESKDSKNKDSKGDADKEDGGGLKKNIEKAKKALQNKGKGTLKNKTKEAMDSMTDMSDDVGASNNGSLANDLRRERRADEAQQAKIKNTAKKAFGKFNPFGGGGGGGLGGIGNMLMTGMKAAFGAVLKVGAMAVAAVTAVITALATIFSVAFIIAAIIFAAIVVAIIVIIVILISIFASMGGQGKDCSNEVQAAETVVASMNSTAEGSDEGESTGGLEISDDKLVAEMGKVYAYLSAYGYSDNQIIGIGGNAYQESKFNWYTPEGQYSLNEEQAREYVLSNYKIWGNASGHAVGLVQYDSGRRTAFIEWAIANCDKNWTNYANQLDYIFFVEPTTHGGGNYKVTEAKLSSYKGSDPGVRSMVGMSFNDIPETWKEQTKDMNATQCMIAWCVAWERPYKNDNHWENHARLDIRDKFVKHCERSEIIQRIRDEAKKYSSEVETFMQTHQPGTSSLTDRVDQTQLSGGNKGLDNAKQDNICGKEVDKVAGGLYGDKLFDQFVQDYKGKGRGSVLKIQCVEGWYVFCNDYLKLNTRESGFWHAYNIAKPSYYQNRGYEEHFDIYSKYKGDDLSNMKVQDGDWLIWEFGAHGHVGMFYKNQIFGTNQAGPDGGDGYGGWPFQFVESDEFGTYLHSYRPTAIFRLKAQHLLGSSSGSGPISGQKYTNLTPAQIKGLANLCAQEQGSPAGAAAEASLMANRYEKEGASYGSLYDYVRNCGWFAEAAHYMDTGSSSVDVVNAVTDVLVNGNRTNNYDEHDYWDDIYYLELDGKKTYSDTDFMNHNSPWWVPGKTIVYNNQGSVWRYMEHPTTSSDPFGIFIGSWK